MSTCMCSQPGVGVLNVACQSRVTDGWIHFTESFCCKESVTRRWRIVSGSVTITWSVCFDLASVVPVTKENFEPLTKVPNTVIQSPECIETQTPLRSLTGLLLEASRRQVPADNVSTTRRSLQLQIQFKKHFHGRFAVRHSRVASPTRHPLDVASHLQFRWEAWRQAQSRMRPSTSPRLGRRRHHQQACRAT